MPSQLLGYGIELLWGIHIAGVHVPPEEALYEQPVGQPNLCSGCNHFKLITNCGCNCLQYKIYSPSKNFSMQDCQVYKKTYNFVVMGISMGRDR